MPAEAPVRIQRKRTPGSSMGDAVYVGRKSRFGNPWVIGQAGPRKWVLSWQPYGVLKAERAPDLVASAGSLHGAHMLAVAAYRMHLDAHPELVVAAHVELAGRDLACWCKPELPCHSDVLLALVNPVAVPGA